MVQNRIFWTIEENSYFVYYPIIAYLSINVYMVETMDTVIPHWNNCVSGNILLEQCCQWKIQLW